MKKKTRTTPSPSSKTFCVLPWINLEVKTDGRMAACCINREALKDKSGKPFHLSRNSMQDAFQSEDIKKLRTDLLAGVPSPNCETCWINEKHKGFSRRMKYNLLFKKEAKAIQKSQSVEGIAQPMILDLKVSRLCNLKCRICGPMSSSLWAKETSGDEGLTEDLQALYAEFKGDQKKIFDWQTPQFWSSVQEMLPGLKRLEFYGGESFLIQENFAILKKAVETKVASSLDVQCSTNGTHFPEKVFQDIFPHFKSVHLYVSIDGFEKQFEYQRHPAKWDQVFGNFMKMKEISEKQSNLTVSTAVTLSALNIFYLPEMIQFWRSKGIEPSFGCVHMPEYFSLDIFPEKIRKPLAQKILSAASFQSGDPLSIIVLRFIDQINQGKQADLWPQFREVLEKEDRRRKEKFADVFPEYAALMKGL